MLIGIFLFILILIVIILFWYFRHYSSFGNLSIFLSCFERLSINVHFTLSPITLLAILTAPLTLFRSRKELLSRKYTILLVSLALVVVSAFLSAFFSLDRGVSLRSSLYVTLYSIVILSQIILIKKSKSLRALSISIAIVLLFISLYAIFQNISFAFGRYPDLIGIKIPFSNSLAPTDFIIKTRGGVFLRPNSTFNDVNTSSGFILLYLPFCLYSWHRAFREGRIRSSNILSSQTILYLVASITSIIAVLLMFSRSSLIGLIFSILVLGLIFFIHSVKRNYLFIILSGVIFAVVIFVGFDFKNVIYGYVQRVYNSEYSAQAHIDYTKVALSEFKRYPAFGGGIGTFQEFFLIAEKAKLVGYHDSVDNPPLYIKYLAEEGIIGFIANIGLILYVLLKLVKTFLLSSSVKRFTLLTILFGFSVLLVSNLFHAYFELFFTAVFIGTALGLAENDYL